MTNFFPFILMIIVTASNFFLCISMYFMKNRLISGPIQMKYFFLENKSFSINICKSLIYISPKTREKIWVRDYEMIKVLDH
jgi:hypothetical protein